MFGSRNGAMIDRQPAWVFKQATNAWRISNKKDVTIGATRWENVARFGPPYWADEVIPTVRLGPIQFYRKKHGRLISTVLNTPSGSASPVEITTGNEYFLP